MVQIKDSIQFETRQEITDIMTALETYINEHSDEEDISTAEEMMDMLDSMRISW